jgi:hypothetical protein
MEMPDQVRAGPVGAAGLPPQSLNFESISSLAEAERTSGGGELCRTLSM